MTEMTYGRGQVEWALWRAFWLSRPSKKEVPKIFRTRIKRLIEIDRELDLSDAEVPPKVDYAFAPPLSEESVDIAYREVDAFCLAVALDLLDAGFKQAEIVFLMRYLRSDLERLYSELLQAPSLLGRQRQSPNNYPDLPTYEVNGVKAADRRIFIIIRKIELTEASLRPARTHHAQPMILEPVFCNGVEALTEALGDIMPLKRRIATVIEIAATAQAVHSYLAQAPVIQRGRPKGVRTAHANT